MVYTCFPSDSAANSQPVIKISTCVHPTRPSHLWQKPHSKLKPVPCFPWAPCDMRKTRHADHGPPFHTVTRRVHGPWWGPATVLDCPSPLLRSPRCFQTFSSFLTLQTPPLPSPLSQNPPYPSTQRLPGFFPVTLNQPLTLRYSLSFYPSPTQGWTRPSSLPHCQFPSQGILPPSYF